MGIIASVSQPLNGNMLLSIRMLKLNWLADPRTGKAKSARRHQICVMWLGHPHLDKGSLCALLPILKPLEWQYTYHCPSSNDLEHPR
jgi:hypothetical protein